MRATLLDKALRDAGEVPEDLATEDFKGSSALRAYTSFVNPRANRKPNNRETHEEGAARTAVQVGFLMREQRALLSEYLRNVDAAAAELAAREVVPHPLVLVLDNVRSAHNVGSIFRTAETACVREIVTCGITPHPPNEKLDKTALSATHFVPSRHFASTLDALAALRAEGVHVVGMETTSRSVFHTRAEYPQPTALVLGNELTGIDTQVMEACDALVEIPTFGIKNSLNVASAAPVVIFEVLRKWGHL